ncbi:hypothetical protein [Chengkuizengella marina]|uniref:Uncharacterized protein n=1 Tax=Chengkuizengella marina TaxID=2507566 RepID=A0A6N9Q1E3_9BACL|nr:hypothetical protein [Chengkuizengella marina]NBI28643.1 hypothetical protein [Chengkuizengella marina]
MYWWRVTKYNPLFRDENGFYTKQDEWTSFYDTDGDTLTVEEYLTVENAYVNAILYFMNDMNIKELTINGLEKCDDDVDCDFGLKHLEKIGFTIKRDLYPIDTLELLNIVTDQMVIRNEDISHLCRLILRNHVWCKLKNESNFHVHFGYDYYMYIGISQRCEQAIEKVMQSNLFVEPFVSPYLDDDEYEQEINKLEE